jgi:Uma2 family endonuclease
MTTAILPAPAATPVSVPLSRDIPPFPIYRLSVEQYHRMIDAGILAPEDRIELIEGWLVPKMSKNRPHSHATWALRKALEAIRIPNAYVDSQEPVTCSESEPEPDGIVVRGTPDDYDVQPTAADVPFVAEASESTLNFDQTYKKRVYAAARIPVHWIISLVDRCVEVYTDPTGPSPNPTYKKLDTFGPGDNVPVVIDGTEVGRIPVNDLLT